MHAARVLQAGVLLGLYAFAQPLHAAPVPGQDSRDTEPFQLEAPAFPDVTDPALAGALGMLNRGELSQSLNAIREYLKTQPASAPGWEVLGSALVLSGELDEGLEALRRAVSLNPAQYTAWTKIGDVYMARGDSEEAQRQFEHAIEIAPDHRLPHQRLGLIHESAGRADEAIHHLELGLRGVPDDYLGVRVNLARLYNARGRFEDSVELLEGRVTASAPPDANILLGTAYLETRDPAAALAEMRKAHAKAPDNPDYLLALGIALREAGETAPAVARLEEVARQRPDSAVSHYQLAEAYVQAGEREQALTHYRRAQALSASPAAIARRIAEYHVALGEFPAAIAAFQEARNLGGDSPATLDGLASAYRSTGRLDLAEQTLQALTEAHPDSPLGHYRLASLYGAMTRYKEARRAAARALELAPEDADILQTASRIEYRLGNKEAATGFSRRALEQLPAWTEEWFFLGAVEQEQKDNAAAMESYRRVLALQETHVGALNNLAILLLRAGETQEALSLAERAHRQAPGNPVIMGTLGWALSANGDHARALEMLQRANTSQPGNGTVLYYLARLQLEIGNREEAQKNLKLAIDSERNFEDKEAARELLDELIASATTGSAPTN